MDDDIIDDLFEQRQDDAKEGMKLPGKVRVGEGALKKAYTLCRIVTEINRTPLEWYGLTISRQDDPGVVRDFIFGEQTDNGCHTHLDGTEVSRLSEELIRYRPEWLVSGWVHSHADMGVFFSDNIDRPNMLTVLNSVYLNTRQRFKKPYKLIEGIRNSQYEKLTGNFRISGSLETDPEILFSVPERLSQLSEDEIKRLLDMEIWQPVLAGWSSSVVVNNRGEIKGYLSYREEYPLSGKSNSWGVPAEIEVVCGQEYQLRVDEASLANEVRAKIKKPVPKPVFIFGEWPSRLGHYAEKQVAEIPGTNADETPETDAADFLAEALSYSASVIPIASEKMDLYDILCTAIRKGSAGLRSDYKTWIGERVRKKEPGNPEIAIYSLIADPAIIMALEECAKTDPAFATFMKRFSGYPNQKIVAVREYRNNRGS